MIAAGIDLGGTKIEAQVFAADWSLQARNRWPTPKEYAGLVQAMAQAIRWVETHGTAPIGISAAGLINPVTGLALTSNLPATGKPFPQDVASAAGRPIAWINDCRALTLSEATLGAAKGADPAVGLILGTGVAASLATSLSPLPPSSRTTSPSSPAAAVALLASRPTSLPPASPASPPTSQVQSTPPNPLSQTAPTTRRLQKPGTSGSTSRPSFS
jgi:N-acetylglucosamine kinase